MASSTNKCEKLQRITIKSQSVHFEIVCPLRSTLIWKTTTLHTKSHPFPLQNDILRKIPYVSTSNPATGHIQPRCLLKKYITKLPRKSRVYAVSMTQCLIDRERERESERERVCVRSYLFVFCYVLPSVHQFLTGFENLPLSVCVVMLLHLGRQLSA